MSAKAEDLEELEKALKRLLRRRRLEMDEAHEDKGEDSIDFLWAKAVCETLEGVLYRIDPNFETGEGQ